MATGENDIALNTLQETTADESERVDQSENPAVENGDAKPEPNLNALRRKLVSAERAFRERLMKSFHGEGTDDGTTRLYHVWPGNNVFLLGGRLICGPDPRGLVLTSMAILMSSWSFAAYVANDDDSDNHGPKRICCAMLTFIVIVMLGLVSMSDPGILPRDDRAVSENRERAEVEGMEAGLNYCRICNVHQPPRSRHCVVCDNCVERFDHHCPWTGQCIGLRNYKLDIVFLLMALLLFAYIFASSLEKMQRRMSQNDVGLMELFRNYPETLALASFAFTASCLLGGLTCYNLYLVSLNQTSYENMHALYASSPNPYDAGLWSNVMQVLCAPRPPPKVDFRAQLMRPGNSRSCQIPSQSSSHASS